VGCERIAEWDLLLQAHGRFILRDKEIFVDEMIWHNFICEFFGNAVYR
jgi:hypothetical protein